jgi:hypothetical protein
LDDDEGDDRSPSDVLTGVVDGEDDKQTVQHLKTCLVKANWLTKPHALKLLPIRVSHLRKCLALLHLGNALAALGRQVDA